MEKSNYTLGFEIKNNKVLFNSLYGTVDLVEDGNLYKNIIKNNLNDIDNNTIQFLKNRKYITDLKEEKILKEKVNLQNNDVGKFYIIFSYLCNFRCPYCFEQDIKYDCKIDEKKLQKLLECIQNLIEYYNYKNSEINLYGGEPLLLENKKFIEKVLAFANKNNIKVSIITNGSNVKYYIELLSEYSDLLNVVSITIDGPKKINDMRRIYKNRQGSYDTIIESINLLSRYNIKTSIRINLDKSLDFSFKEFIDELYNKIKKDIPINLFRVEDNKCTGKIESLLSLNDIVEKFNSEEIQYIFKNYNVKNCIKHYSQIKELIANENMVLPLFKYCAVGNLFTFDPSGNIFICPESAGDRKFTFGKYFPEITINRKKVTEFRNLSTINIDNCNKCNLVPICGGGCPYESFNFTKKTHMHNCKYSDIYNSIKKYIELNYFNNED